VIINPAAGRGAANEQRDKMETLLSRAVRNLHDLVSWRVVETTGPGSATTLAREAVSNGVNIVVAAGGDGTVLEVLNGIIGSDVKLAIIPLGTGNDFARTLGSGLTIRDSVLSLFYGDTFKVDVGKCADKYFINIAGCGFDAVVANRVNTHQGRLKGRAVYMAAVYRSLRDFDPVDMELTLDGETRTVKALLCAVANARYYGGGMRIAPDAMMNDGLFEVCVVGAGKWEFVKAFPRVFKGTHVSHPDVLMLKAKEVRIECAKPLPVLLDGEMFGNTPCEFKIIPGAVSVIGPEIQFGGSSEEFGLLDKRNVR